MAGAAWGVAVGLTEHLTGSTGPPATLFPVVGLVAGAGAWWVERRLARRRPALLDAHGCAVRPPHVALYLLPAVAGLAALAALAVLGAVASGSPWPVLLFAAGGLLLSLGGRRALTRHRLRLALEALERGDGEEARRRLANLVRSPFTTRQGRETARLNLGMVCLARGDRRAARRYFGEVDGDGRAVALGGVALLDLLEGDTSTAAETLTRAMVAPGSAAAQGLLDGIRLLLVLREDGAEAAYTLGRTLLRPDAGPLLRGVLAAACFQSGAPAEAYALLNDVRDDLERSGWAAQIPELVALLERAARSDDRCAPPPDHGPFPTR